MKNKFFALFFYLSSFMIGSSSTKTTPKTVELIIFIHGTIKPPEISFSSLSKIMSDKLDDSILALATQTVREDPFFYRGQPIQELGLKTINVNSDSQGGITTRTAQTIVDVYNFQYVLQNTQSIKRLYYTFGWNGLLSPRKRYEASQELYDSLQTEIAKLKQENLQPKITLVTYSHGGNVALYLAKVEKEKNQKKIQSSLTIDNLVMLACPIQQETDYLVEHPLFKKVYTLYSTEDFIQQWDLFANKNQLLSQRMFVNRKHFTVPSKVTQIRVRVTKKIRGIPESKIIANPKLLLTLNGKSFIHRDPGHMEMGGFSWGNIWYRDIFPLYPLPIIALVPTILTGIEQTFPTSTSLTYDFISHYNSAIVSDSNTKIKQLQSLWSNEQRIELWDNISTNVPLDYTVHNQNFRIEQALKQARDTLLEKKKDPRFRHPHSKTLARLIKKAEEANLPQPTPTPLYPKNYRKPHHRFTHYVA